MTVLGGALGARATSTAGTLVPGLTLAIDAHVDTAQSLYGSWLKLFEHAQVGPLSTDHLTALAQAQHGAVSPFVQPPALPPLQPVAPGSAPITILWSSTESRPAGSYGAVDLKEGATLVLPGGLYQLSSLLLRPNARIQAQAPVQIRVSGAITFLEQTSLLPTGAGMSASSIQVQTSQSSPAASGPPAIELRSQVAVRGLLLAPNGTIQVREHVNVTGALAARDIEVYPQASLTFQGGFSGGACPPSCDDGNPCTTDGCTDGACTHSPAPTGASCSDGNPCNGAETCSAQGVCQAGPAPSLDDGNPCTADSCDPQAGPRHVPVAAGVPCADGDACNGAEACDGAGLCAAGLPPALDDGNPCTLDSCDPATGVHHAPAAAGASCADGNACNGGESCDGAGHCQAGAPPALDDGNPCTVDACQPATGVTHTPRPVGASCADGDACNGAETCDAQGVCQAGPAPSLDDGNPCTLDSCQPSTGVSHVARPAGASCSDGDACNGAEACDAQGICRAGSPPAVDDGNPCTADSCQPSTGVVHAAVPAGSSCSDGNVCNGAETCNGSGQCQGGQPLALDDGNPCTVDSCAPGAGVAHEPRPAGTLCGDQDACNGSESCDGAGHCQAGAPPALDDGNPCTADACDPQTGAVHTPLAQGSACSDGNVCNGGEVCNAQGACVAGQAVSVDDGNPCTVDACDPALGVTHAPAAAGADCSDGNACNGGESCDGAGHCQAGAPPALDDGNPCTVDACQPATGITHTPRPVGASCAGGNACQQAACNAQGQCVGGQQQGLDDGNPCTVDACDPVAGVTHAPAAPGAPCADADVCNGLEVCDGSGACVAGVALPVDDGNPCTVDSCHPLTGVHHAPTAAGTPCPDGDVCNGGEVCDAQGACVAGAPPAVDDGDPCTADACHPIHGVRHEPLLLNAPCPDGDVCNGVERCDVNGVCQAGVAPAVDDGNPCTIDSCDPVAGVRHVSAASGVSCSDGDVCNGVETCDGTGQCHAGVALAVDDGNPCTLDSCDPATGVHHLARALNSACDNGTVCDGHEACDGLGACVAGLPPSLDDGDPCTVDSCDPAAGVRHVPAPPGSSCSPGGDRCHGLGTCDPSGECVLAVGPASVDDGNPCTLDACDPATGQVSHAPLAADTPCGPDDPCAGSGRRCDGAAQCVASQAPPSVDDGNPCTLDLCQPGNGIVHFNAPAGAPCGDGNACNGGESCDGQGACQAGVPVSVDDGDPCTVDSCNIATGAIGHAPAVDGAPCKITSCATQGTCQAGTCVGSIDRSGLSLPKCLHQICRDDGSITIEPYPAGTLRSDGNPCNGIEVCDGVSGMPTSVDPMPAGELCRPTGEPCVVGVCSATRACVLIKGSHPDFPCQLASCDAATGEVTFTQAPAGAYCDDHDLCNGTGEQCDAAGQCVPTVAPPPLDDGNPCTQDYCTPAGGTEHYPLWYGTSCGDGDVCNGDEYCDGSGHCLAGVPVSVVPSGDPCVIAHCDPQAGLVESPAAAGTPCPDGDVCNGGEACDGQGACAPGAPPALDDGDPCTLDSCDPWSGVAHVARDVDDANECTIDGCDASGNPTHAPVAAGTPCPDTSACNGVEVCNGAGLCVPGPPLSLDDGNPCTADSCDPWGNVLHAPFPGGAACSDGNACNGSEICDGAGHCLTGAPPALDDGNPCTVDACDPALGVTHTLASAQCSAATSRWSAAASRPSPRDSAAMAYDPARGRLLLFGGENAGVALGDTWSLDPASGRWDVSYLAGPAPRAGASALFDPVLGQVLLFGGARGHRPGDGYLADLWSYDGAAGAWSEQASAVRPAGRAYAAWAYDAQRHVGVLFGGTGASDLGDTWHWRSATRDWVAQSGPGPLARGGAAMAYDPARGKLLLFGGAALHAVGSPPLGDTWEYDAHLAAWTQLAPATSPPARAGHGLVFDAALGRVLLHGGVGVGQKNLSDAWTYDAAAATWTQLAPSQALPAGPGQSTAALASTTVAFGGLTYSTTGETARDSEAQWSRDASGPWKPMTRDIAPAQLIPGLAYDPARQRLVALGRDDYPVVWEYPRSSEHWEVHDGLAGQDGYGDVIVSLHNTVSALFHDTATARTVALTRGHLPGLFTGEATAPQLFSWDGATWTSRSCAQLPGQAHPWALSQYSSTYDPVHQRAIVFGGYVAGATPPGSSFESSVTPLVAHAYMKDGLTAALWELDVLNCRWTHRETTGGPSRRVGAHLAWDRDRSVMVLHGGFSSLTYEKYSDTWEWSPTAGAWQATAAAPTTVLFAAFDHDPISHRTLRFGGEDATDHVTADTWAYDGATHTWAKLSPAHSPPARYRASIVLDETRGRLQLIGGQDASERVLRDWWEWDGSDWVRRFHGASPAARNGASGAWSHSLGAGVVFGGVAGDGRRSLLGDTWLWQDGEWFSTSASSPFDQVPSAKLSGLPSPPHRAGHTFALSLPGTSDDLPHGLLFGGEGDTGLLGDTWTWDPQYMRWEYRKTSFAPPPRTEHAMVAFTDQLFVLFGGRTDGATKLLDDTWTWGDWSGWQPLFGGSGPSPAPRASHALATDVARGTIVLFGGRGLDGALNDTWEWSPPTQPSQRPGWTRRHPPVSPPPLFGHRLSYDSVRGKVLLTGGWGDDPAQVHQQTWEWDGDAGTWTQRSPAIPLAPRVGHVSFFDAQQEQTVVLGGLAYAPSGEMASTYGDQWSFADAAQPDALAGQRSLGSACASGAECASSLCVEGLCCNSPCDLACGSCAVPGHEGVCSPLTGAPRPTQAASCQGDGVCAPRCDGADMVDCHPAVGLPCLVPHCQDGFENGVGLCQGDGACAMPLSSCGPFACDGDHCGATCDDDSDCSPSSLCGGVIPSMKTCLQRPTITYFSRFPYYPFAGQVVSLDVGTTGSYPQLFRFSVLRDSTQELPCGDYQTSNHCDWMPAVSGQYELRVEVKHGYSSQPFDATYSTLVEVY